MQYIPINTHTYNMHYNIISILAAVFSGATRNNILSVWLLCNMQCAYYIMPFKTELMVHVFKCNKS